MLARMDCRFSVTPPKNRNRTAHAVISGFTQETSECVKCRYTAAPRYPAAPSSMPGRSVHMHCAADMPGTASRSSSVIMAR